jgi:hypothetical protein
MDIQEIIVREYDDVRNRQPWILHFP